MELPYTGRATIDDNFNTVDISIPSRKNWFIIIFLSFWMCIWLVIIIALPFTFFTAASKTPIPFAFMSLWLCGWAVGGFFAFRTWLWNIIGKEIITISQGVMTIDRKGVIFYKAKSYDLNEARNFRAQEDPVTSIMPYGMSPYRTWRMGNTGTIKFDYGMKTVKFGEGVDEAEGSYLLQKLRDKKLIS